MRGLKGKGMATGYYRIAITCFERLLALAVLVGVVIFAVGSAQAMMRGDWRETGTFYDLIYRVLLLVIGLELVRTLITHDLAAILELLAFVIARKMLKPDLTALDIVLSVAGFSTLLVVRHYFLRSGSEGMEEGEKAGAGS
jgi:hypothetical protein